MRRGFTLIELMLVVAIMGLLGTVSVGGYRAMRQGMEERGVMQNVNQFIRNAYQRAMIDRQPTAIYFWNETRQIENDDSTKSLQVVGRAVAVRRAGRITYLDGTTLVDEFGDLRFYRGTDDEGDEDDDEAKNGVTTYLYKINGDETQFQRSKVSQTTIKADVQDLKQMMSDPTWKANNGSAKVLAYGYYLHDKGKISWKVGDAYGLEFAEITLPNNYIFEKTYKTSLTDPIQEVNKVLRFSPERNAGSETIAVYAIRPGKSGEPESKLLDTTESADSDLNQQNK